MSLSSAVSPTDTKESINGNGAAINGTRDQRRSELQLPSDTGTKPNNSIDNIFQNEVHLPGKRRLFQFSGFDQDAGTRYARHLTEYLKKQQLDDAGLNNLAYTLHCRRSSFPWKATIVAGSSKELIEALEQEDFRLAKARPEQPNLGFVFTGQGAQWARMGVELLDTFPVYLRSLERSRDQLKRLGASWDLIGMGLPLSQLLAPFSDVDEIY